MNKVRRIDFYPDEFISGVARLTPEQVGVYWLTCSLIASSGGEIGEDDKRLQVLRVNKPRLKRIISELILEGKLHRSGTVLTQNRITSELEHARKRIGTAQENGRNGGRPSHDNKDLAKPDGLTQENPLARHYTPQHSTPQQSYDERFERFWITYPRTRRGSKTSAYRLWKKTLQSTPEELVFAGLSRYCASRDVFGGYAKAADVWLRNEGWNDEPIAATASKDVSAVSPQRPQFDDVMAEINKQQRPFV